jgi:hypothetical protein
MHQDVLARLEKIKSESEIKKDSTAIDGTSVKN